jgi:hypothetical protein
VNQSAKVVLVLPFLEPGISSVSRPTGEWKDTDYDVVSDGVPVGRISTVSGANFGLD